MAWIIIGWIALSLLAFFWWRRGNRLGQFRRGIVPDDLTLREYLDAEAEEKRSAIQHFIGKDERQKRIFDANGWSTERFMDEVLNVELGQSKVLRRVTPGGEPLKNLLADLINALPKLTAPIEGKRSVDTKTAQGRPKRPSVFETSVAVAGGIVCLGLVGWVIWLGSIFYNAIFNPPYRPPVVTQSVDRDPCYNADNRKLCQEYNDQIFRQMITPRR